MVGYLHFTGRRERVRLIRHQVLGLTVFEVRLPGKENAALARRRLKKGLRLLEKSGCRRLLAPCPEPSALPLVHTRALWQTVAAPLALADLREQGLDLRKAVVALHTDRVSPLFLRACRSLAREVRALSLSLDQPEELEWLLRQELGIPLVQGGGNVTVSFLPGVCRKSYYALGGADPAVSAYHVALDGLTLPENCPELSLLAALLDAGRLPLSALYLVPNFP